jgi:hypothetical protein
LMIVDADATPEHQWTTQKLLRWFRHRSSVLLLSTEASKKLEDACDSWLPKTAYRRDLCSYIKNLYCSTLEGSQTSADVGFRKMS